MAFADMFLTCRECGKTFVFTAGEQEFYAQKGFLNDPVRCPDCRRARKQAMKQRERRPRKHQEQPAPPSDVSGGRSTL